MPAGGFICDTPARFDIVRSGDAAIDDARAGGECMRSVKVCAFLGALGLLGGCVVSDDSPVAGGKQLDALSGREVVALCDWSRDYWGGYAPNDPTTDEGDRVVRHRCPVNEDDLWDRSDTIRYVYWNDEGCGANISMFGAAPCRLTVDEWETLVRGTGDEPCSTQTFDFNYCTFTYVPEFEE
jgi:hypothetical protein